jgi:hypothetical protein
MSEAKLWEVESPKLFKELTDNWRAKIEVKEREETIECRIAMVDQYLQGFNLDTATKTQIRNKVLTQVDSSCVIDLLNVAHDLIKGVK